MIYSQAVLSALGVLPEAHFVQVPNPLVVSVTVQYRLEQRIHSAFVTSFTDDAEQL